MGTMKREKRRTKQKIKTKKNKSKLHYQMMHAMVLILYFIWFFFFVCWFVRLCHAHSEHIRASLLLAYFIWSSILSLLHLMPLIWMDVNIPFLACIRRSYFFRSFVCSQNVVGSSTLVPSVAVIDTWEWCMLCIQMKNRVSDSMIFDKKPCVCVCFILIFFIYIFNINEEQKPSIVHKQQRMRIAVGIKLWSHSFAQRLFSRRF